MSFIIRQLVGVFKEINGTILKKSDTVKKCIKSNLIIFKFITKKHKRLNTLLGDFILLL